MELTEGFEGGSLGDIVSRDNTSFWMVDYESDYPEDVIVEFTDDSFQGRFAATIPPEVVIAQREAGGQSAVYQRLIWVGSSPNNLVIDEPVKIEWFYKYVVGSEPFFGRLLFEAEFDLVGNPILYDYGDNSYYPEPDYNTSLYLGLEHSNEDVGDDPDGLYYYHSNTFDLYEPMLPGIDIVSPQPPMDTWLKMTFDWQGAGLPFSMRIVTADDESIVHMDITHTAPTGLGLSYWWFTVMCTREDASAPGNEWVTGYDFQNWFDGVGTATLISGRGGTSRSRFGRAS